MPDFVKLFDASGRKPRSTQVEFLRWLESNWRHSVFTGQLPVGSGKSAIARAVQLMTGAHVITPSNILIDQYTNEYDANFLKGKTHYDCKSFAGISCQEWTDTLGQHPCKGCVYTECKERALVEPTFFNPMSLYYLTKTPKFQRPEVLIVDEAHQLSSMLLMLSGLRLRRSQYRFSANVVNERNLVVWLSIELDKLFKLKEIYKAKKTATGAIEESAKHKIKEIAHEIAFLKTTYECFMADPQNYVVWVEDGKHYGRPEKFLNIKPLHVPEVLRAAILDSRKLILMSGTLFETDIKELVGNREYQSIDLASPIPIENRRILYKPAPFKINAGTDPAKLVRYIEEIIDAQPGSPNTIIHVSYAASQRLRPHFSREIIFNTKDNKDEKVNEFKERGGVFLASGCSEGLDLKGAVCRLNIIPQLLFPNLVDPVVQKRKALADGQKWYSLEAMKAVIQQAGRSTRSETDFSTTFILDPNFSWCFQSVKQYLPKSFKEAIQWGG